jgi:hypothetical protein
MRHLKPAELVSLIHEGTAATTGAEFFPVLVRSVARALHAYNVLVSRFDAARPQAEILVNWVGEALHFPIVEELRTLACNFDTKAIRSVLRPIVGT